MSTDISGLSAMIGMSEWPPAQLFDLADVLEIGIIAIDTELHIEGWNRFIESASGIRFADVAGQPLLDVFPDLKGGTQTTLQEAAAGKPVVMSQRLHRYLIPFRPAQETPGFEFMQQSVKLVPLDRDGVIKGVIIIIQDVTERVVREEEMRKATQVAEDANRAKSDFLATMSHELRTPLNAVIGYTDLLSAGVVGPVTKPQTEYLARVRSSAWHLIGLIDEILLFSRIEAGMEDVDLEVVDLRVLVDDTAAMLQPQAREKGLEFHIHLPEAERRLETDARKLRQIILNLLSNAVKFTDAGSVTLQVSESASGIGICVTDTGPGIPPADLDRVFQPFVQVEQTRTRKRGGTGLGLSVSRHLAEMLGGTLVLSSPPGGGCIFTLFLPFSVPNRDAAV